jgi:hypothetical protein
MPKNHEHTSRIQIYQEYEVDYNHAGAIREVVAHATNEPEIFDYRCAEYEFRKLTDTPHCRIVTAEEEKSWCGACGAAMTHVRPGKWQCDACDNLEVWKSAAEALYGYLQGIEQGFLNGRYKADDEVVKRLQTFLKNSGKVFEQGTTEEED